MSYEMANERVYRGLVGSLLFLAKQIMWRVNVLSRFMDRPTNDHWNAGKRVLRYLQETKTLNLRYPREGNLILSGETDAAATSMIDDQPLVTISS